MDCSGCRWLTSVCTLVFSYFIPFVNIPLRIESFVAVVLEQKFFGNFLIIVCVIEIDE